MRKAKGRKRVGARGRSVGSSELQRAVTAAVLHERERISLELHDSVAQELAGANLQIRLLEQQLQRSGSPDALEAAKIGAILADAMQELRCIVRRTGCLEVSRALLPAVLRQFCADTAWRYAVDCRYRARLGRATWGHEVATNLYCIIRESVGNAVRHGRATRIVVSLSVGKMVGQLSIVDNGCGISVERPGNCGMGFKIMRYRADALGGQLTARRNGRRGTAVSCDFPVLRLTASAGQDSTRVRRVQKPKGGTAS